MAHTKILNFDRINEQDFSVADINGEFPMDALMFITDDGSGNVRQRIQETRDELPLNLNVDDNADEFLTGIYRGVNKYFVAPEKDNEPKNNVGLLQRSRSSFRDEVNKYLVSKGKKTPLDKPLPATAGGPSFDINEFLFRQTGNEADLRPGTGRDDDLAKKLDDIQESLNRKQGKTGERDRNKSTGGSGTKKFI